MNFPGKIKDVRIKGRLIGGDKPALCVPLVEKTTAALAEAAGRLAALQPDIIEWRVDYFDRLDREREVMAALETVHREAAGIPLLFTCRHRREGGQADMAEEGRISLVKKALRSGLIDLLDLELLTEAREREAIIQEARQGGIYVILSFHDFRATPARDEMVEILVREQEAGADIAKIAVMPQNPYDVLSLLEAALIFRERYARIPAACMSMSRLGIISRIAGHLFGSAIIYAAQERPSAPGQLPLDGLRRCLELLGLE
jgi:3-dehydroquinate dehydratase-1